MTTPFQWKASGSRTHRFSTPAQAYAARPDINAVVHTHSLNATVLACAHKPIPAFHYMVAAAGGADIPLVPYATFGTPELAALVALGL